MRAHPTRSLCFQAAPRSCRTWSLMLGWAATMKIALATVQLSLLSFTLSVPRIRQRLHAVPSDGRSGTGKDRTQYGLFYTLFNIVLLRSIFSPLFSKCHLVVLALSFTWTLWFDWWSRAGFSNYIRMNKWSGWWACFCIKIVLCILSCFKKKKDLKPPQANELEIFKCSNFLVQYYFNCWKLKINLYITISKAYSTSGIF